YHGGRWLRARDGVQRVRHGAQGGLRERQDARPVRQRQVVFVVDGARSAQLDGGLGQRERNDARGLQLRWVGGTALAAAAGEHVIDDAVERGALLVLGLHLAQATEDDGAAVVHGVVERGARQHDP